VEVREDQSFRPGFNIGPMRQVPVFTLAAAGRLSFEVMQWGVFYFGNLVINARFEEAREKRMFKQAVEATRCLLVFDGYYEWKQNVKGALNKQGVVPYYIKPAQSEAPKDWRPSFVIAGLYFDEEAGSPRKSSKRQSREREGAEVEWAPRKKVVLMTQSSAPNALISEVHHRMPVFLTPDTVGPWLDCKNYSFEQCERLIEKSLPEIRVEAYEVSDFVNSIKNDSDLCILPRKAYREQQFQQGLGRFFAKSSHKKPRPEAESEASSKL